ncbi:MAG TPA: flavoprotein [Ktedonosporobacter sp.]|nr:flavoprotein [Ktedonosporobacter sp.]
MSPINRKRIQIGHLYIITCASSSAPLVYKLVLAAQTVGWDVCVILTPRARNFVDVTLLEQLTGHPVRSDYKHPDEPDVLPRADALIVFPATFNTLNKWALGISDTLAVGLLSEYTGLKLPIVAVPCFKTGGGLDTNPAFLRSIKMLRRYGVHVIYEPQIYPPKNQVPPPVMLETLERVIAQKRNSLE